MPLWLLILILASMLAGLSFAAFAMWLHFKETQTERSTAAQALAKTVADQQTALEAAERRIQNLEAIVASEAWDAVTAPNDASLDDSPDASTDTARVARWARHRPL